MKIEGAQITFTKGEVQVLLGFAEKVPGAAPREQILIERLDPYTKGPPPTSFRCRVVATDGVMVLALETSGGHELPPRIRVPLWELKKHRPRKKGDTLTLELDYGEVFFMGSKIEGVVEPEVDFPPYNEVIPPYLPVTESRPAKAMSVDMQRLKLLTLVQDVVGCKGLILRPWAFKQPDGSTISVMRFDSFMHKGEMSAFGAITGLRL